ncbi:DUF5683 domain-containing protein [Saprospiraceae bacterium]|nr:DUF5683 domain-containing protein [Saprospiraceae bacterium]
MMSSVILISFYTYAQGQVEIDTTAQPVETIITTESGVPIDVPPIFETELDSINYYSQLQERQDSIAKAKADIATKLAAEEKEKEEEEEEEDIADVPKVKEDKGYGIFSTFQGNPGKAGLYSLVVPGLGQAYNKRWWKVPLAIGAEATAIFILVNNIKRFRDLDSDFRRVLAGEEPVIFVTANESGLRNARRSAKTEKDYAWVGVIAVHIIVAADAFVDRHLIEFDVDDDLSIKVSPFSPLPGLNIVMTF